MISVNISIKSIASFQNKFDDCEHQQQCTWIHNALGGLLSTLTVALMM